MTPLEKIRAACIAANPEIVELHLGCIARQKGTLRLFIWNRRTWEAADDHRHTIGRSVFVGEILGREIRLADVLLAIGKKERGHLFARADGNTVVFFKWKDFSLNNCHSVEPTKIEWKIADNLESQSPETVLFLSELL